MLTDWKQKLKPWDTSVHVAEMVGNETVFVNLNLTSLYVNQLILSHLQLYKFRG